MENWKAHLKIPVFRNHFILSMIGLILTLKFFGIFVRWVETRPGILLPDPILLVLPATETSALTFSIIYSALVIGIISFLKSPRHFLLFANSYTILVLLRGLAMWLTPLAAPPGMITLVDPVVETFTHSKPLTQDLFFSGHTSLFVLLTLTATNKILRVLFTLGIGIIGFLVLLQHVHYSVDVLAALAFGYLANQLGRAIQPLPLEMP